MILRRWWPPLVWLGLILTATSIPSSLIPHVGFRSADKAVHAFMYAGLGFLISRAMENPPRTTAFRVLIAAFLLCVAIGATDEWHQKYMQGRSDDPRDLVADSIGGLIGATAWALRARPKAPRTT